MRWLAPLAAVALLASRVALAQPQAFEVAPGLTVGVQRLPAVGAMAPAATPTYFVAGGPGVSGFEELQRRPAFFARLRSLGEVVIVEQRGTGSSLPALSCSERWQLPTHRTVTRGEVVADARRAFAACAAALRARGIELSAYRTEHYAADLRAVMRALDHERVRVFAHSYGTMIALELLRLDRQRVERAVLAGVMGPGDALRDPDHHERVLATLAQALGLVPALLRDRTAAALTRVALEPIAARTAQGDTVVLGRDDIARGLVQSLGRPAEARTLPALIDAIAEGRADTTNAWFTAAANSTHLARTGVIARRAAAQHFVTVCANGESPAHRAARTREGSRFWPPAPRHAARGLRRLGRDGGAGACTRGGRHTGAAGERTAGRAHTSRTGTGGGAHAATGHACHFSRPRDNRTQPPSPGSHHSHGLVYHTIAIHQPVAAGGLGAVQRGVGLLQHRLAVDAGVVR